MPTDNGKQSHQDAEARLMKRDFIKSLLVNGFFLLAIIALYILNRKFGFLDTLADKF